MKTLNGFGKKYFSLSSIQAHSVAISLHNKVVSCKNHLKNKLQLSSKNDEEIEELEPTISQILLSCFISKSKPCHCDCFFRKKTALAVRLFKFIPRCPYYTTYFAFRRTGVHPPLYTI
ncbi:hypothetical protein ACNSOS_05190 [Aliarcobacter vitoriensis]|uniref:hypothetical protein n=1 Tax=Aliarcobacter vitoriensis TaxID=2011099 RepID=UPI000DEAF2E7|nr:hypothetical protein CRU92_08915 [Arcobacter sp. FW59]